MKKIAQTLVSLAAGAALVASGATQDSPAASASPAPKPGSKLTDLFPDTAVAKGKGFEIKRSQLEEEYIRLKSHYTTTGQNLPPDQAALLEQQVLDQLIQIQLLLAKATEADRTAGKTAAETKFDEARTKVGSEENLNRQLKAEGLSKEELISRWTEAATAEAVAKRDLKVNITDEDLKKYYDDNPSRFEQPEMVKVSHILLATKDLTTNTELSEEKKTAKRKLLEELLKRARAGEDFSKLAKDYSEDPSVKQNNGEYTFARASADPAHAMVLEFEAAAFSLSPNQVSDIVTTQFGYHIIKLLEKIPAKKLELSKVSSNLKDYLAQQAMQKQVPEYMAKLKKEASVEYLDERLKPKEPPAGGTTPAFPPVSPAKK